MLIAFDLETTGLESDAKIVSVAIATATSTKLYLADEGLDRLETHMELGDKFVGHNIAGDWAWAIANRPSLLGPVFHLYDSNRVHCTEVREKLLDIREGCLGFDEDEDGNKKKSKYTLEALAAKHLRRTLDKGEDSWRTRYGTLLGLSIGAWPQEAIKYAEDDARSTFDVCMVQRNRASGTVINEHEQVKGALCLRFMSNEGVRTDPTSVELLGPKWEQEYRQLKEQLQSYGIFRPDRPLKSGPRKGVIVEGSEDTKKVQALVVQAYKDKGIPCPETETGAPARDEKTLRLSGNPLLQLRAKYGAIAKNHDTYLPILRKGVEGIIHPGYDILKNTGRTSSYGPNFQNLPTDGGIRECFVPPPGHVFSFADYSSIELVTWGECCLEILGYSDMAMALNKDLDVHTYQASVSTGIPYEELARLVEAEDKEAKKKRQAAKAANFGLPGLLGGLSFMSYSEDSYGVVMNLDEANRAIANWKRTYREAQPWRDEAKRASRRGWVMVPFSNRVRGQPKPTQAANTPFQGLAADGMKAALWLLAKAMYLDRSSPLYGSKFAAMIHDEVGLSIPESDHTHEAVLEQHKLMVLGMQQYVTRVKVKTGKPAIAKRWYKEAATVFDKHGRLTCWEPKKEEKHAA
jgi:hypothetical protein